jgi:hypothetical protein
MTDQRLLYYEIILANIYCYGKQLERLLEDLVKMSITMLSLAAQMCVNYKSPNIK